MKPLGQPDQSAALPYRISTQGRLEILLVTSRTRKRWVLPKGKVKQRLLPSASAAREAFEEAGVIGHMSNAPIGSYERRSSTDDRSQQTVEVYSMAVRTDFAVWPEMGVRQRRWMSVKQALKVIPDDGQREIIRNFADAMLKS